MSEKYYRFMEATAMQSDSVLLLFGLGVMFALVWEACRRMPTNWQRKSAIIGYWVSMVVIVVITVVLSATNG